MDSEAETDTPDIKVQPVAPKRKPKVVKRDPNEEIPVNWQRRPHLADRMPVIRISDGVDLNTEEKRITSKSSEAYTYSAGDFSFVACDFIPPSDHVQEDLGAAPNAFRIARIMELEPTRARINWLLRPSDVLFHSKDSRELYLSFEQDWISIESLRGKCLVQARQEIRNLDKYREKTSQFWFSKLFYGTKRKLYDAVPTVSMKVLGTKVTGEISLLAQYAILAHGQAHKLCEQPRKRKAPEDLNEESTLSEEELKELADKRLEWPFRYFDHTIKEFAEPCIIPQPSRIGNAFQTEVDDWPGQPLLYYTEVPRPPHSKQKTRLRLVEAHDENTDLDNVDTSKPWVQKMPSGYIPRGDDATSTPVSLPTKGLSEFVSKCQTSYADTVEVHPSAVNFLDACCSIFVNSLGGIDDAFVTVSRLTRKQLREPDLHSQELATFKKELDPFSKRSWHEVFKAVGSKPVVELCQYYWVDLPSQPKVPASQIVWNGDDPEPPTENDDGETSGDDIVCAICLTDSALEWKSLPGYIPLPARPEYSDSKVALCLRCARLWYRYKTNWVSPDRLEKHLKDIQDFTDFEPELIEDRKSYLAECDRRDKRRQHQHERKQAIAQKREDARKAKKAAKEGKGVDKGQTPEVSSSDAKSEKKNDASADTSADAVKTESNGGKSKSTKAGTKTDSKADGKTDGKPKSKKPKTTAKSKKAAAAEAESSKSSPAPASGQEHQNSSGLEDEDEDETEGTKDADGDGGTTLSSKSSSGKKKGGAAGGVSLSGSLMSLDQVDQILDEIDEELPPEAADYSNYCAVCGQLDPSMAQETCTSCGLNVHIACYGTPTTWATKSKDAPSAWLCDCCLNARGELMNDLNYQCSLCSPRMPTYGSWLNGSKVGAPDVLKNTIEKSWCHMRCALWTPGVKFGDPGQLRDIDLSGVSNELWKGSCKICSESPSQSKVLSLPPQSSQATNSASNSNINTNPYGTPVAVLSSSGTQQGTPNPTTPNSASNIPSPTPSVPPGGQETNPSAMNIPALNVHRFLQNAVPTKISAKLGAKVKCEYCDDRFHVSCAADKGYHLGLTKETVPRPIIVCQKHLSVDLTPMSQLDLNLNLTAMQIYAGMHKVSNRHHVNAMDRSSQIRDRDQLIISENETTPLLLPILDHHDSSRDILHKPECRKCHKSSASYWYTEKSETGDVTYVICPLCYHGMNPLDQLEFSASQAQDYRTKLVTDVFAYLRANDAKQN